MNWHIIIVNLRLALRDMIWTSHTRALVAISSNKKLGEIKMKQEKECDELDGIKCTNISFDEFHELPFVQPKCRILSFMKEGAVQSKTRTWSITTGPEQELERDLTSRLNRCTEGESFDQYRQLVRNKWKHSCCPQSVEWGTQKRKLTAFAASVPAAGSIRTVDFNESSSPEWRLFWSM